ncbi:DUF4232 domain-containing protein [Streptomyces piniterrae]|uniref:DUF4232 domain-containing protein n=1 Tax=Streptomyces piniterrae TaxID=2571125 RepID=A0A4U0N8Z3_9ACTN|nr:DUF4232 domain-containing protein [Streptomyces piniterrae]TJZ50337.1 DUF4232 domain-containing protein [Streptomyces piniterrae]
MPFSPTATAHRGRRTAAVSLLAAAALSLTACDGKDSRGQAPSPAVSPSADRSPSTHHSPSAQHSARPHAGPSSHTPGPTKSPTSGTRVACTPEMLRFHAGAARRPINHMVLTVTNISDRTCDFAGQPYPKLRFGGEQRHATPVIRRSRPGTAVSLAPDATAYAGVTTSAADRPDGKGEKISQFGVTLARHTAPTQVGLDNGAPVYVDVDTAKVTYWQSCRADALKW